MSKEIQIPINGYPIRVELMESSVPRVACLGPEGTYTEEARHIFLGEALDGMTADFLEKNDQVVRTVDEGKYDIGIVPIENSIEGDVVEVLRELIHVKSLAILGETVLSIDHMLIGPDRPIDEIYSHPQAFAQCRTTLLTDYPQARLIETNSTAAAIEKIKGRNRVAAIASRRAALLNDMPILQEHLGDNPYNTTRFLLLGRGETQPTGEDATSLMFTPEQDYPGSLVDCLNIFKDRGINLIRIASRPTGRRMGQYMFLVTLNGHHSEQHVSEAIYKLTNPSEGNENIRSSVKIFGSYRRIELPEGVRDPSILNGG